jgi:hypothetical protein
MNRTPPAAVAALVALLAGLCPGALLAAGRDCSGPSIEADASLRGRWPELVDRIRRELMARADLDACARIELQLEGESILTVSVTLPDGRAASRSVTRRDDVIPVLQALLLVPDAPRAAPSVAAPSPAPAVRRSPSLPRSRPRDRDAPPTPLPARELGFELSVLTGARAGDGQVALGVGALSFLEVKSWLLGFAGRVDAYRPITGGDPETALELGILGGKRFDLGGVALDLSAGPAVAMKGLAVSRTEVAQVDGMAPADAPPPPPPLEADPSSGPVPRLLLGARFGFSPRSVFRTFVGIDGEVGPARDSSSQEPTSGRLPTFAIGLAVGATVGTP